MKTTLEEKDGVVTVKLEGRMDTTATSEAETVLHPLFECRNKDIVVDCSGLEYISSSGLRLFLNLLLETQPAGNHVYISGMSDFMQEVFDTTGFSELFDFK